MNLLLVTQRVDRADPILGFFHSWIEEFARRCGHVIVLGQAVGEFDLPTNVTVLSLGKEKGASKAAQICRFLFLLWKHRGEYDVAFIHMTPVWAVIGCPLFMLLRKPVYLWYEIRRGGRVLRMALSCVRKVFSATKDGMPFPSTKNVLTGHGIDTDRFSPGTSAEHDPHLLVTVGRLTRIKRHELFLQALAALPSPYRLSIAGGVITAEDQRYRAELTTFIESHHLQDRVTIVFMRHPSTSSWSRERGEELPALLRRAAVYLHAGGGGLDKALLEAMACECPVISASEAAVSLLPESCRASSETFTAQVQAMLARSPEERAVLGKELRQKIIDQHSLPRLIERLVGEMS